MLQNPKTNKEIKKENSMNEKQKSYLKLAGLFALALGYIFYQSMFDVKVAENKLDDFVEVVLSSPSGEKVSVISELAANEAKRSQGLMYRRDLAENEGMLFLWKDADIRSFWMKNTYIPLDMIFMNGTNIVGFVENAKPHSLTPRTVAKKANAVLETPAGFVKKNKVNVSWKASYSISDVIVE